MHVLGVDRSYLYSHGDDELGTGIAGHYFDLVRERGIGKPTQYITGRQEFWGLEIEVTPDVLIPRPETEHLVESVVELARSAALAKEDVKSPGSRHESPQGVGLRIVDVGTGSGCIALALASEIPQARLIATDISRAALRVAQRNTARLGLRDRVSFVETDLLAGVCAGAQFDVVVSNPPYVGSDELDCVQREVREFEPRLAWGGAGEGEAIYRRLFPQSWQALRPGGYVVVEVGYNQAGKVLGLLKEGWAGTEVRPDLAGIPRVVMARKGTNTNK